MAHSPLDLAHAAMQDSPGDDAARLRFYHCLADSEVFLLLVSEAQGADLSPRVFPLEDGPVVLIFDSEDRLAEFAGGIAPYAALPGRVVAQTLAGQGVGLGVNLGVAPSAMVLPPDALIWLVQTLAQSPQQVQARPLAFHAPRALPEALTAGLAAKFARAGGLAEAALLAAVDYDDGRRGHVLAFVNARPDAHEALARACAEALTFSGIDAGEMDVTFLAGDDPAAAALARVAQRFDLTEAPPSAPTAPSAPGSDPARPPRLR